MSPPLPIEDLEGLVKPSFEDTSRNVRIESVEWKYLTEPGENFGSLIFAVNIGIVRENGHAEELNVVVKLPPKSAYLQDLFNSPITFDKELRFYRDVVPALRSLQIEKGFAGEKVTRIAAKYFAGRLGLREPGEFDEQAAIVLENLSHAGYSTRDRLSGLDERHTVFAVKTLAALHASTVSLKLERADVFAKMVLPALRPYANETAASCLQDMVTKARADLRAIEELKDCIEAVEKTLEYAAGARAPTEDESPWKTLLHNDFWTNNMMFRSSDDGHPVDMKIVDFQLCLYDYGVKDLLFFLMSSAQKSVVDRHLDDMIDLYYCSFIETLRSLQIDTGSFAKGEFFTLVQSCAPIKFEQCIFMTQVIQATRRERDSSAGAKENADETPSFFSASGMLYREKLIHVVRTFERKGWLIK